MVILRFRGTAIKGNKFYVFEVCPRICPTRGAIFPACKISNPVSNKPSKLSASPSATPGNARKGFTVLQIFWHPPSSVSG